MKRTVLLGLLLVLGGVLTPAHATAGAMTGAGTTYVDSLLIDLPLPDGQPYRRDVVIHDSLSTVELIQLREGLETVRHATHHLTVFVMRGATRLTLGSDKSKLPAGAIVNIPRGTSYAFHSMGHAPAVLMFVYSPRFSGKDRIMEN